MSGYEPTPEEMESYNVMVDAEHETARMDRWADARLASSHERASDAGWLEAGKEIDRNNPGRRHH